MRVSALLLFSLWAGMAYANAELGAAIEDVPNAVVLVMNWLI